MCAAEQAPVPPLQQAWRACRVLGPAVNTPPTIGMAALMAFESCGALKASPTPGSESDASGLVHPRGDVALFVKHAPDVNVLGAFDVKDQIGIAPQRPKPQISEPELMRMARRSRRPGCARCGRRLSSASTNPRATAAVASTR